MARPKSVCLDFDGVIASYDGHEGNGKIGEPIPGVKEFINELIDDGYIVYVCSARMRFPGGLMDIAAWLMEHGFHPDIRLTLEKPVARVYIDDRGIRFDGSFAGLKDRIDNFTPWWENAKEFVQ